MQTIGFIGLGKMGNNMVLNLLDHKKKVVVYDRHPEPTRNMARKGAIPAYSLEEMVSKLPKPRVVWIMITAGKPTESVVNAAAKRLDKGDIIIDGGNSFYKDSQRRYAQLKKKGIHFLDCGTSGGQGGARHGACMMVGGDKPTFKKVEWAFQAMCIKDGYGYMGKSGAGHFVKMVHNGIEYGMMAAISEGMQAVLKYQKQFGTDINTAAKVYGHGSIISGSLVTWMNDALKKDSMLKSLSGEVPHGETEEEMKKLEQLSPMPVLHAARMERVKTRTKKSFAGKVVTAMRHEFGGHDVKKSKKN